VKIKILMTNRGIWAIIVATAFIVGTLTTGTLASAAPPADNPGKPFDAILEKLDEILAAIGAIDPSADVRDIKANTDNIPMIKSNQYIPFNALPTFATKVCATSGNSDTDSISISSLNGKPFILTSLQLSFTGLSSSLADVDIRNLRVLPGGGSGPSSPDLHNGVVFSSIMTFDVLGLPTKDNIGTYPNQVAANAGQSVQVIFGCTADGIDVDVRGEGTRASGWKHADDTIIVTHSEVF